MAGRGTGFRATDWVWHLKITPTQKLVMLALASRADESYSCYPGMSLIAEETGLSKSSITRALTDLEKMDLMLRASRKRKNGSATTNRYYLSHPEAPHVTGDLDPEDDAVRIAELAQAGARSLAAVVELDPSVISIAECEQCDEGGYVGAELCGHDAIVAPLDWVISAESGDEVTA